MIGQNESSLSPLDAVFLTVETGRQLETVETGRQLETMHSPSESESRSPCSPPNAIFLNVPDIVSQSDSSWIVAHGDRRNKSIDSVVDLVDNLSDESFGVSQPIDGEPVILIDEPTAFGKARISGRSWRTSVLSRSVDGLVADENCIAHYYLAPLLAKMEKTIVDEQITVYQTPYGFKLEKRQSMPFVQFYWFTYNNIPLLFKDVDYYGCIPIVKLETIMRELAAEPTKLHSKPALARAVERLIGDPNIKAKRHVREFGSWEVVTEAYVVLVRGFSTGPVYEVFVKPTAEQRVDDFFRGLYYDRKVVEQIRVGDYRDAMISREVVDRIRELGDVYTDIDAIEAILYDDSE